MTQDIIIIGGAIFILLLISGFLSGSETALTASSAARMKRLEEEGTRRARWVMELLAHKDRLLSAILLLNNLVNILASALATALFLRLLGGQGVFYATLTMTVLVVIFAEVLPKTYAILTPDKTAMRVAPILRLVVWALAPITRILQIISRSILRLAGFKDEMAGSLLPPHEEIRGAIDLHHQQGGVVKSDRDMLGGILDLGDTRIEEVMVHRRNIYTLNLDDPPQDIIQQALESAHTRIPFWRDNPENIVGILHTRSLFRAIASGSPPSAEHIESLLTPPWFIPEQTLLSEQLKAFQAKNAHIALVVDEYGALMGLVTIEDILEEIVGQIDDEHDEPQSGIKTLGKGRYQVVGAMTIRDLNRDMGWSLPDTEATTLAGLIIHEAQSIPAVGQIFQLYGMRFRIISRRGNRIHLVNIRTSA